MLEFGQELRSFNREALVTYMDLLKSLHQAPNLVEQKLSHISSIFTNMTHLLNTLRAHQGRQTVISVLTRQTEERNIKAQQLEQYASHSIHPIPSHLSIYLSIYLSICLLIHPSIHPCIHRFVCPCSAPIDRHYTSLYASLSVSVCARSLERDEEEKELLSVLSSLLSSVVSRLVRDVTDVLNRHRITLASHKGDPGTGAGSVVCMEEDRQLQPNVRIAVVSLSFLSLFSLFLSLSVEISLCLCLSFSLSHSLTHSLARSPRARPHVSFRFLYISCSGSRER